MVSFDLVVVRGGEVPEVFSLFFSLGMSLCVYGFIALFSGYFSTCYWELFFFSCFYTIQYGLGRSLRLGFEKKLWTGMVYLCRVAAPRRGHEASKFEASKIKTLKGTAYTPAASSR